MATLSRQTTWSDGQTLTASALNAEFNNILNDYNGGITNANISGSAAIAYSKLSLTGSILNADISASAAIAVSKLATDTAFTLNNNVGFQGKDSGGTARNLVKLDASDNLQVGVNDAAGHTVINAGSSKLVKVKVLRQDDTTNTYKANTVILTGFGYKAGDTGVPAVSETISFGITFSEKPVVLISELGSTAGAVSDIGTFDTWNAAYPYQVISTSVTVGSFIAVLAMILNNATTVSNFPNTRNYGYAWIAIGQLN